MNLQFISDSTGETTGVYIPIKEWNELKGKFKEIDQVEIDIPGWHKDVVRQRIADYKKSPEQALDFDTAIEDIDNGL
jgi:hypothetical protein